MLVFHNFVFINTDLESIGIYIVIAVTGNILTTLLPQSKTYTDRGEKAIRPGDTQKKGCPEVILVKLKDPEHKDWKYSNIAI